MLVRDAHTCLCPYKPVLQSCAVASPESGQFWRATGQSNLADKRMAATKASKVWFSYSHNCTVYQSSIVSAKSDCSVARQNTSSLLANAHDCETGL